MGIVSRLLVGIHHERCGQRRAGLPVLLRYPSQLATVIVVMCSLAFAQSKQAPIGNASATEDKTESNEAIQNSTNVLTYHNDPQRTGWNPGETVLTPTTVNAAKFGLLATVPLDDRVDAQPLLVARQVIEGQGLHSVLYVVTENNTVYAIDALNGAVLKTRTLGPKFVTTGSCAHSVGIDSTPTIDLTSRTLFLMSATVSTTGVPEYHLHALDLETLADRTGSPVIVTATQNLENGKQYAFNATYQRQRPALLESEDHIYAGFGSFGDCDGHNSRGWVLGWDKSTLRPMPGNVLPNRRPQLGVSRLFLSSIWMSGYGLAADNEGDIYFTTSNTEPETYDEVFNISESAVRLSNNLSQTIGFFTPANVRVLDIQDGDYGSGGLMVLPDQEGPFPHLAVAAGKDGRLFVLNRDSMGGHQTKDVPDHVLIGDCWCGPSYFEVPEGHRVVTSGDASLEEWSITTEGGLPSLSLVAASTSAVETSQHDPGFFTSISSDGLVPDTAIIWAVGHGSGNDNSVTLHAFRPTPSDRGFKILWSGVAGSWPSTSSNPNIVPTVANGHVYVASIKELRIFGLLHPAVPPIPGRPSAMLSAPQQSGNKYLSPTASSQ
jgi:hypothetical protein